MRWSTRNAGRPWTPRDVDALHRLIDEGHGYTQIAQRLRRTRAAVKKKAQQHRCQLTESRTVLTTQAVADLLGIRRDTVRLWIGRYGLSARNATTPSHPYWRIDWLDLMAWLEEPTHWMAYDPARVTEWPLREHLTEIRSGQPQWVSARQAAARLCISPRAVSAWIQQERLPAVRYQFYWINERDLATFIPPHEQPRRQNRGAPVCAQSSPLSC